MSFLWIGLGGAIGAMLRYGVNLLVISTYTGPIPFATLLVNVVGSLLIGLGWSTIGNESMKAFLLIGLLGGFTTFSSFSMETIRLWENGEPLLAAGNILLNNSLAILFCLVGYGIGKAVYSA